MVATALCADRVATAAPALRAPEANIASRLVNRLQTTFRRSVAPVRIIQFRQERPQQQIKLPARDVRTLDVRPQPTSPFQFRLPPPTL